MEQVKEIASKPVPKGILTVLLAIGAVLGVQVAWPGARLDAVESRQMHEQLRLDTLRNQFNAHVQAAARADSALLQKFTPIYIGECLDRPSRETDIMRLGCDTLVTRRPRGGK